jgi:hypothetical protein
MRRFNFRRQINDLSQQLCVVLQFLLLSHLPRHRLIIHCKVQSSAKGDQNYARVYTSIKQCIHKTCSVRPSARSFDSASIRSDQLLKLWDRTHAERLRVQRIAQCASVLELDAQRRPLTCISSSFHRHLQSSCAFVRR